MDNYAYEKRALVHIKSNKTRKKNKKKFIIISVLGLSVVAAFLFLKNYDSLHSNANPISTAEIKFNNQYDNYSYNKRSIVSDFGRVNFVDGGNRLFIKEDALCIKYPRGGEGVEKAGARINSKLVEKKEYNLEYEICFDGNGDKFDWKEGGMLSGLLGGQFYDGIETSIDKDGFHAMLMYNNYGYLYPCVYLVNNKNSNAKIYPSVGKIKENTWMKVKMYVKLNDINKSNGIIKVWIDDKLCFVNEEICYVTDDIEIDKTNVQAICNKSNDGKGVKHEEFVYIDNISIY